MILKIIAYIAAASLVACLYLVLKKHAALLSAEQFRGTVIGHLPQRGSKGGTLYALQIEYRNKSGATKHFIPGGGASKPPARPIGAEVVVFEHADGKTPDILVFENLYLGYWLWFCFGIGALGCLAAPFVLRAIYLK